MSNSFKSNFAGIIPGMLDKAILEFEDQREVGKEIDTKRQALKSSTELQLASMGLDPEKLQKKVTEQVEATMARTMRDVLGSSSRKAKNGTKFLRYEVLFNPNRISLTGHGTAEVPMNECSKGIQVTFQTRQANLELRIPLIVDRTISSQISMGISIPGVNSSLVDAGKSYLESAESWLTDGESGSIQRDVEMFAAMLRNNYTRMVSFYWGDMTYTGILTSANSTYTIFDPNGHPTRATIELLIILADANNPVLVWNGKEKGPWMEYYKKAFTNGKTSLGPNWTQNAQNILGL
ncbi:MAG: hypothetical protein K6F37_00205 [Lachnospiraceae bacterium]|nr:hypothetical protein [Lachnospiraceae bacterium]